MKHESGAEIRVFEDISFLKRGFGAFLNTGSLDHFIYFNGTAWKKSASLDGAGFYESEERAWEALSSAGADKLPLPEISDAEKNFHKNPKQDICDFCAKNPLYSFDKMKEENYTITFYHKRKKRTERTVSVVFGAKDLDEAFEKARQILNESSQNVFQSFKLPDGTFVPKDDFLAFKAINDAIESLAVLLHLTNFDMYDLVGEYHNNQIREEREKAVRLFRSQGANFKLTTHFKYEGRWIAIPEGYELIRDGQEIPEGTMSYCPVKDEWQVGSKFAVGDCYERDDMLPMVKVRK